MDRLLFIEISPEEYQLLGYFGLSKEVLPQVNCSTWQLVLIIVISQWVYVCILLLVNSLYVYIVFLLLLYPLYADNSRQHD